MRRTFGLAVVLAVGFTGGSSAMAAVTAVGPFTGDLSETFENIMAPGPHAGPMPIFGGLATIDDQFTDPWITTSLSSSEHTLFPYDGNLMALAPTGFVTITFNTPVLQFGGYFGSTIQGSGGSVTFLDSQGQTIDVAAFNLPVGQWTWQGWQSDTPIASIQIFTNEVPGTTTVYDNFEVTLVPTPGALALLALGAVAGGRRRRR